MKKLMYQESIVRKNGGIWEDVANKIKCGWMKWREAITVLCDNKVSLKIKRNLYKTIVKPAMMCGSEYGAVTKKEKSKVKKQWLLIQEDKRINMWGKSERRRPKKKWIKVIREDIMVYGVNKNMIRDRVGGRKEYKELTLHV